MTRGTFALWVYLSRTPLLSLTVTLVAYLVADRVSARTDRHPPQSGAARDLVHRRTAGRKPNALFDVFRHDTVARAAVPMLVGLLVGFIVATGSAILIAQAFGAPPMVLIALAPKSVTARRDGNNVSARRGSGAHRRPSDRDRYHSRRRGHPAEEALSAA